MFDVLGMERGDQLIDVFPGSGAVTRAWLSYQTERMFA
jgi:precorrin-6B methylase 2